ncbi:glycosyl hydrolase [Auriculariales sp. MPI-PUGE-AT-0066]|nr:glycosyl hydrolase [Auriculariales sp. MPI-PUGE-AT-0066]
MKVLPSAILVTGFLHVVAGLVHRRATTKPLSTWMADSIMARNEGHGVNATGSPIVSYEHGEFQQALRALFARTGDLKYLAYIKEGIDAVVSPTGEITSHYNQSRYSLDDLRIGPSMIKLLESTGDSRYKIALQTYRVHLYNQPRNTEGGFWHRGSSYPYQMWLDGIYMAEPFYTLYARDLEHLNATAFADIENQFKLIYANTFDDATKLLKHGYFDLNAPSDLARPVWVDAVTGAAPHIWDRAVGWYVMALTDMLIGWDALPPWTSAYRTLLAQYRQLVPALAANADPESGAWWLVLTDGYQGREGNYIESSGSVMFCYAMLKAVRSGLVPDPEGIIRNAAIKAYDWIGDNMLIENADGTLSLNGTVNVGSLGSNGTFEYYISQFIRLDDLKGTAAFVLASLEYELV